MGASENRFPLGNVYRLAWRDDNPKVRMAALFLLLKGQVSVECVAADDMQVIDALRVAGCEYESSYGSNLVYTYTFTCDGAKMCYENGAFYN